MKEILFAILFIISHFQLCAQAVQDSLWNIWENTAQPDTVRLMALDDISIALEEQGSFDSLFLFQEKIYDFANQKDLPKWKITSLSNRSFYCLKYNLDREPLPFMDEAISLVKEQKDTFFLSYLYSNRGYYYALNQNTKNATQDYLASLALVEMNIDSVSSTQIGMTSIRLGLIYKRLGDNKEARRLFYQAINAANRYNLDFIKGSAMTNIGSIFFSNEQVDSADYYWTRAYALNKKANNLSNLQSAAYNLSMIKLNQGKLAEGKELLKETKFLSEKFNNTELLFSVSRELGAILMEEGNYTQGVQMVTNALNEAEKGNFLQQAYGITEELFKYYESIKDYKNSLKFHKKHILYKDSIYNEEKQRELYRQESKYQYEKQAITDSLQFAQKELLTQATIKNQRLGLMTTASVILLLLALAYSIFKARQRAQAEAVRVTELDAFKSKFYTNITHEFRTPLTVILGMANQIEENPKKNLQEGIELIKRNGKNLLNQINQILDLSKIETKSFNLNPIKDELVGFVRYATMSFQSNANSRNLSLRFFTPLEKFQTNFDPDALQKIVQNLVSNALKYTLSGGEVKVYLKAIEKGIEIKVQDTGVGISEDDLTHIFDRFYQVENPADKTIEGTGIGLAYVQELVRVMEGEISVESAVGEGSEFVVFLPFFSDELGVISDESRTKERSQNKPNMKTESTTTPVISALSQSSSLITPNSSLKTLPHLLLIEDNPDVVAYLKNCLDGQYNIDIAYNGRIGIDKAIETIPDLIITDVMMPEVGGYEVCDTLKTDERTSHIPIIMLTAKADMASKIAGLKRGADAYLAKPFDKDELMIRMERMVERQQKLAAYFSNHQHAEVAETIEAEVIKVEDVFIQKVKTILEKNYSDEGFALPQLCSKIGMSRSQLFRKMKALVNESPSAFIRNYRLEKAKELLEKGELNVSEVAWKVGFGNLAHFSKAFQERFGVSPSQV